MQDAYQAHRVGKFASKTNLSAFEWWDGTRRRRCKGEPPQFQPPLKLADVMPGVMPQ